MEDNEEKICTCDDENSITIDPFILKKLEQGFESMKHCNSESLLKKHLSKTVFDNLKKKKTSFGSNLYDCIKSGFYNHDSIIGIYASDPEVYTIFADIFNPIIADCHPYFKDDETPQEQDWGNPKLFENMDTSGNFILRTSIECSRCLQNYPFLPRLTEQHYKEIENKIVPFLRTQQKPFKGKYFSLEKISEADRSKLIEEDILFVNDDRYMKYASGCKFWPVGRGIFYNTKKNFIVWINEGEHFRAISRFNHANISLIYKRLVTFMKKADKKLKFVKDDRLGYLSFNVNNLGCTIRASVLIRLPKLSQPKNKKKLDSIIDNFKLDVRGTRGEHSETEDFVFDVSNKQRLGITEFEAVKSMYDGVLELIKAESSLK